VFCKYISFIKHIYIYIYIYIYILILRMFVGAVTGQASLARSLSLARENYFWEYRQLYINARVPRDLTQKEKKKEREKGLPGSSLDRCTARCLGPRKVKQLSRSFPISFFCRRHGCIEYPKRPASLGRRIERTFPPVVIVKINLYCRTELSIRIREAAR